MAIPSVLRILAKRGEHGVGYGSGIASKYRTWIGEMDSGRCTCDSPR